MKQTLAHDSPRWRDEDPYRSRARRALASLIKASPFPQKGAGRRNYFSALFVCGHQVRQAKPVGSKVSTMEMTCLSMESLGQRMD